MPRSVSALCLVALLCASACTSFTETADAAYARGFGPATHFLPKAPSTISVTSALKAYPMVHPLSS